MVNSKSFVRGLGSEVNFEIILSHISHEKICHTVIDKQQQTKNQYSTSDSVISEYFLGDKWIQHGS